MKRVELESDTETGRRASDGGTPGIPNRDGPSRVRVLLVEDDPAHAELARRSFDAHPGAFEVSVAETVEAARELLISPAPPDVVIADWRLPDGEGVDLLRGDPEGGLPPVVVMTSQGSERVAVEVMRAGAADYVVKSEASLADLAHVASRAFRQRRVEDAVGDIAAGAHGEGDAFFQSIVLRLARVLRVKYASVAELVPGSRLRTLGRCIDGRLVENVEYPLPGTPCAQVLDGTVCYIRQGVAEAYPADEGLRQLGAQSYVGAALSGSAGQPIGLVNAIHERPLDEIVRPEMVVQVFASRASAELERRRAEAELERQRVFAESLLDMVASLVMVVDAGGRILRFNRACEKTTGWTENEVRGQRFWEVLRPPDLRLEPARQFGGDASLDDLPPAWESVWLTRAGERRLISWAIRPITDDTGRVAFVLGTGVDITDSRRTEEALRASEARYRTLMQNAPEAILVAEAERDIVVDANANAESLFGLAREDLLKASPSALLLDQSAKEGPSPRSLRSLIEPATEGGTPVAEVAYRTAAGQIVPCEVRVVRLPGPGHLNRFSIIDIGERKRLEAGLRTAAIEWRETFDGLPLGVLVVDGEGRVVRANRAAVEHAGRDSWADLIDTPLARVSAGETWVALGNLAKAARSGRNPAPVEVTDSATGLTWVLSASSLPSDGDGPGRVVLNFQDVSQTAQLKEQLRQSETMAAIGSIVAGVAHEVRNPLFSISATLDAFESRFGGTEGYSRYLAVLRGEIGRLTTLMKDLLEFGRPSEPELARCDLADVTRTAIEACTPLLKNRNVEVTLRDEGAVLEVLADRVRMTQVLQNLIENAAHYSPHGGRVEIGLRALDDEEGAWVECTVCDSGPGFAPADLEQLFEPFFTRRTGGTGLGLSIVRRIVYDHGGHVFARNSPEGGAVVVVRLKRAVA